MSTMFPSLPNACGFNYVNLGFNEHNYSPEDNDNIGKYVEVETSPTVPENFIEMLSSVNKEEDLLTKLSSFGSDEVAVVEKHTRGQNSNDIWKHQRFGRITASVSPKPVSCSSLLNFLCPSEAEKTKTSPAMQYGIHMEEEARMAYVEELKKKKHKNVSVKPSGLFLLPEMAYIAASPDGLVKCDCCGQGLLEIKCPHSVSDTTPNPSNLNYLKVDDNGKVHLSKSHPYYSQIQHQMGVTGKPWCDFFVYSRHGFHLERLCLDTERWNTLREAADYFFRNHVASFLVQNKKR